MAGQREIEEIKSRIPIEDVVSAHVQLHRAGGNLRGLCPFHGEKTPSFHVWPDQGTYHCFGCSAHGDIFTFTQQIEHIDFAEALERLAHRAGVELQKKTSPEEDRRRKRLVEALEKTEAYWHDLLLRGERAAPVRAYLEERGITRESVLTFRLGWAPDGFSATMDHLLRAGVSLDDLLALGLVIARDAERGGGHYDRFRNRLIFPIRDGRGRLTGFGGRALDPDAKPKYLNSTDSPLFDKSNTLYAIEQAQGAIRDAGQVVIVEGYVDALIAHQFGIKNVVASLGTALTERQVGLLKRLTSRLVLALDADAAGSEATVRGLGVIEGVFRTGVAVPTARGRIRQQAAVGADIRILAMPEGEDPDEVIRRDPDAWRGLVERALPFVDFYILYYTSGLDLEDAGAKATAAALILDKIALLPERVAQAHYIARLAGRLNVPENILWSELTSRRRTVATPGGDAAPVKAGAGGQPSSGTAAPAGSTGETAGQPATLGGPARRTLGERVLLMVLAQPEQPFDWGRLEPEWFDGSLPRELVTALAARGSGLNLEDARGELSPVLADYLDGLLAEAAQAPRLTEYQIEHEVRDALDRLKRESLARRMRALRRGFEGQPLQLDHPDVAALMAAQARSNAELDQLYAAHGHVQDPDYSAVGGERRA